MICNKGWRYVEHGIGMELATAASYLRAYYRVSSLLNCHVNTFHEFSFCICCQNLPDIRRVKGRDGFRCSAPRLDACQISRIEGLEKCPSRGARSFLPWVSGKKNRRLMNPFCPGPWGPTARFGESSLGRQRDCLSGRRGDAPRIQLTLTCSMPHLLC